MLDLLKLDLFQISPQLSFDGKKYHKSWPGVITTYLFIVVTFLAIINFGEELYVKRSPIVTVSEIKHSTSNPPRIQLNANDIKIAFGLFERDRLVPLDPSYFKFSGKQIIVKQSLEFGKFLFIKKDFNMIDCPKSRVPRDKSRNQSESSGDSMIFCMGDNFTSVESNIALEDAKQELSGLYVNGFFGAEEYSLITIGLSTCKNDTRDSHSPVCKPQEEINKRIGELSVGGVINNKYLDLKDYDNPFRDSVEWFYTRPNKLLIKGYQLFFQKGKVVTDRGFLTREEEEKEFFHLSDKKEFIEFIDTKPFELDPFVFFTFEIDNVQKDYSRRYKKIQDVAAEVGGIMKVVLFILALFLHPIELHCYKREFLRLLADDNNSRWKNKPPSDKRVSLSNFKGKTGVIKKKARKLENLTFELIEKKIDLLNILQLVVDFENLLEIIFEKYQRLLFKHISGKISLHLNKQTQSKLTAEEHFTELQRAVAELQKASALPKPFDKALGKFYQIINSNDALELENINPAEIFEEKSMPAESNIYFKTRKL